MSGTHRDQFNETDADSDSAHRQKRFDLFRELVINNQAWCLDRLPDVLALDTVDELVKLLRTGEPSRKTLEMLADFLQGVSREASTSAHAWQLNTKLAYRILDHKPNGRTGKAYDRARMLATFETLKGDGIDEETAERAAYDTYFEREGRTYGLDQLEKDEIGGAEFNKAEITMEKVIRPALRQAGLIGKKPSGRPKLSQVIPTETMPPIPG